MHTYTAYHIYIPAGIVALEMPVLKYMLLKILIDVAQHLYLLLSFSNALERAE